MRTGSDHTDGYERRTQLALIAGVLLCLVASGGLLWWRYGGAVFSDMVLTTLAWCF